MTVVLTDEQVAALKAVAEADLAIANAPGAVHLAEGDDPDDCSACRQLRGLVALAIEVQQTRVFMEWVHDYCHYRREHSGVCRTILMSQRTLCADFTPKDGAK